METAASGRPMVVEAGKGTAGSLMQNFLEGSNVDLSGENVRLRFLQSWRSYVLHAIDERADESNATLAHFREQ
jgi:flagellar basal body rod protein FlgG